MTPAGAWPETRRARFAAAAALGLAAVAYLCFALPLSIYLGNSGEFGASWRELLLPWLVRAVPVALAFAAFAALLPPAWHRRVLVLAATLLLLAWVQGNLLVWEYGLFDGSLVDWSRNRWLGWLDLGLWAGALLAADAWRERLARVLPRVAIVLCALHALLAAGTLATRAPARTPSPPDEALAAIASFSPRSNVLHIVADGVQTDVFEQLLEEDGGALARELDGFVLFEDNLGAFPYTHMSVPAMLAGRLYDNSQAQAPFLDQALGPDSILGAARAAGFEVQVGMPGGGLVEVYRHARGVRLLELPDAPRTGAWRGARRQSLLLADLVLFRIVPHFAKRFVYNEQQWLLQALSGDVGRPGREYLAHEEFLRGLATRMEVSASRPSYKLLHLMLSHRPMVVHGDCSYAGRVLEPDADHVRDQVRCALRPVRAVLARMRALGIYEQTTVVLAGDHGTFLAPASLAPGSAQARRAYRRAIPPGSIGHARPLLLVKPARSAGPLRRTAAPSWIVDTPATIADAAGIPGRFPGRSALRLGASEARPRRYFDYPYEQSEWTAEFLPPIREYLVDGRSDDIDAWRRGRLLRAPGDRR